MTEEFSSIKEIEKIVHIALPITFITDEIIGINEILESWKKQYNNQLEGILVKYSNVSLISRANRIVQDKFCAVVNVKAKFYLFCPNVGDIVKGRIKRISKEHVGCIMHDTINAVIKLTEYCPDELKKFMRLNQDILFEITHFDRRRKEIFVVGKITPHCLELMNELIPLVPEENASSFTFLNQNVITRYDFDDIEEVTIKNDITAVEIVNLDTASEEETSKAKKRKRDSSESEEGNHKKKKKRKKDKIEQSDQILDISKDIINGDLTLDHVKLESNLNNNNGYEFSNDDNSVTGGCENEKKPKKSKKKTKSTDKESKHSKKKKTKKDKSEKKSRKLNSKKGKLVASGAVLNADKKKSRKNKNSSKESNKKEKSKNKDKKRKKSKHKANNPSDVKIKSDDS